MFLLNRAGFFWDAAIAFLLIAGGSIAFIALQSGSPWLIALGGTALLSTLLVFYGSFIEPRLLFVTRRTVRLSVKKPLRIVVMADLHVDPYKGETYVRRAVKSVNAVHPDLILLPGDFIFDKDSRLSGLSPLKELRASIGVFATMGNHDYGAYGSVFDTTFKGTDRTEEISAFLKNLGIIVLRNEHMVVAHGDERIVVAGVGDPWVDDMKTAEAFRGADASLPSILLSHSPDIILDEEAKKNAHLVVSCHTHGGQIRLPWIGPLVPIPMKLHRSYAQGLFAMDNDTTLAVTRGAGESGPRARLFAPPEILLLLAEI